MHSSPQTGRQTLTRKRQPLLLPHLLTDLVYRVQLLPGLERGIPRTWVPRFALVRGTISRSAFLDYLSYLSIRALVPLVMCLYHLLGTCISPDYPTTRLKR